VRRCAISSTLLGIDLTHHSVSVFRHMEWFATFNPLFKAPTLMADDGTALMESALILQHFEDITGRSLRPAAPAARLKDLRLTGLATVAADKAIAIEYERKRAENLRSADWTARITGQLRQACTLIELELTDGDTTSPGALFAAIAWGFVRFVIPHAASPAEFPRLHTHATACEATAAFRAWPIDRE
jgi:glutathione S-transferase